MGYRIDIDYGNCLNCGVCMDVCPVAALDMSRPVRAGVEAVDAWSAPNAWAMEYPVQVGECIGCAICIRECPTVVMTLATQVEPTSLARRQGPLARPAAGASDAWVPLSEVTLESLKPDHPSPWGDLFPWRTAERPEPWMVWRSMLEGAREDPIAPCQEACPALTDAGRYVGLVAEGRYDDAYAVAAEVNPFPSVCGWICTAPCEAACRRGTLDEPISIRTIKRFAAERGHLPPVAAPDVRRAERIAIVGGGPAGMSAAYYLARLGYRVTVFEAMPVPGGMMAIGIPEYRLPREVLRAEVDRIVGLGVDLRLDSAMGRDFTLGDLERQGYSAIFIATGASKSRRLGVPGDALPGVVPATLFLKRVNLGEQPRLAGNVVVVGGGSTAMDAARSALRSGAVSVTVAYRRGRGEMPAQPEEVEAAEHEGIVLLTGLAAVEVESRDGEATGLRVVEQRPTGDADRGRAVWAPVPGTERTLAASTILVAIGEEPDPSILPEGVAVEVSELASAVADVRPPAPGRARVFAGGDFVSGPATVIDAVAAGRRAAGSIHEFLAGVDDGEAAILSIVRYRTPPEPALALDIAARGRVRVPLPVYQAGSFRADQVGFDEEQARAEASRCFRCDAVYRCGTVHVVAGRGPREEQSPGPGVVPPGSPGASTTTTMIGGEL